MTTTAKKTPLGSTFDGLVIGPQGNGMSLPPSGVAAGGGSSLDLNTLTELKASMIDAGFTEKYSGTGRRWKVTHYGDDVFEVLGCQVSELPMSGKKRKVTKPRATDRKDMNESQIEGSIRRSRKVIRQKVAMMTADRLMTYTTRESIVESEVFKRIVSRFLAYLRKQIPDFQYVAVFERHMSKNTSAKKYGSLHLHMATQGWQDYKKLRHLWRKSVQLELKNDDYEGAGFDCQEKHSSGGRRTATKLARYISKYLTKDIDDEYFEPNKRRYWSSKNITPPDTLTMFSVPACHVETFRQMWEDFLGVEIPRVFQPDREPYKPPLIWMSTC